MEFNFVERKGRVSSHCSNLRKRLAIKNNSLDHKKMREIYEAFEYPDDLIYRQGYSYDVGHEFFVRHVVKALAKKLGKPKKAVEIVAVRNMFGVAYHGHPPAEKAKQVAALRALANNSNSKKIFKKLKATLEELQNEHNAFFEGIRLTRVKRHVDIIGNPISLWVMQLRNHGSFREIAEAFENDFRKSE